MQVDGTPMPGVTLLRMRGPGAGDPLVEFLREAGLTAERVTWLPEAGDGGV